MYSIPDFITQTAQDCAAWGVPYRNHELRACALAYSRLLTVSRPAQARLLFDELVTESLDRISPEHRESPWSRVANELDFETSVAKQDNRRRVAVAALEQAGQFDDAALDLLNDRLSRPAVGCTRPVTCQAQQPAVF